MNNLKRIAVNTGGGAPGDSMLSSTVLCVMSDIDMLSVPPGAVKVIEKALPRGFPKKIHMAITSGLGNRLKRIEI
jgi:hypothetical protein